MKFLLIILTATIALTSCAQSKQLKATSSYGFFRQNSRGTIPVDENNNPLVSGPDSQYVAYIEIPSSITPVWVKAWIKDEAFDIHPERVKTPALVGETKDSQSKVELEVKPGNTLWLLNLQKGNQEVLPTIYKNHSALSNIIVKGVNDKKEFYFIIDGIQELNPTIYP